MERVATNRGIPHEDCMIAATFERLGTWVTVTSLLNNVSRSCLVVDVPRARDRAQIERKGIIAELSYEMAWEICQSVRRSPQECPIRITR